jgi:hypothetical protein
MMGDKYDWFKIRFVSIWKDIKWSESYLNVARNGPVVAGEQPDDVVDAGQAGGVEEGGGQGGDGLEKNKSYFLSPTPTAGSTPDPRALSGSSGGRGRRGARS